MIKSLWISKTGMDAQQTQLDVVANNLANVSTTGYKASRVTFQDAYYQTLRPGTSARDDVGGTAPVQVGTGVTVAAVSVLTDQGAVQRTGQPL
ncbi:MAG: flagellar hook-basal body complex protein, partial [Burkholderiaceae bacterium]|nr:flagellar hook-basal body complex protein [Burkholderiaceae bacterium]